jgi:PhnB protein
MEPSHKPAGHNSASPYLIVDGADATLGFLATVFGATPLYRVANEAGRVKHAEVRIDDSVLMVADAIPPAWPAVAAHVHVYVSDVDATYQKALAAGATSVQVPSRRGDEDKRGGVRDSGGTTWWIASRAG